ncbi:glycosyltransferase family 4 protein [Paeniglutamicibacter sp. ABSL32-1]|uniref:glycosyltransferase family 4 protein n=1 Tax=Paeniglutamicibacter quisquiliarum TaxID=2849498 RepID=UPI001C2D9384|nr:glycosyltransferase family 4 protein [Paeniglutamicibacter quisquiliarum]MBV1780740.1 glycosyltransferase family 4 protein [Paeniglutamicibacter quisquiliarum]
MAGTEQMAFSNEPASFFSNFRTISRIVCDNLLDDPIYFFLQAARRVDSRFLSSFALACVRFLPKRAIEFRAVGLLLAGNTSELSLFLRQLDSATLSERSKARLGNIAIAIQDAQSAAHLLQKCPSSNTALCRTSARHAWYLGDMQGAIDILASVVRPSNKQLRHYESELKVFRGDLAITAKREIVQHDSSDGVSTLHFLTNSLPHTGSGYAQRSHSILTSLRDEGWKIEVLTRAGYPLTVGKIRAKGQDIVDGIAYRRVFPARYRSDMGSKIQQQADALASAVERLRPSVLHTTTDFSNALAVMSVAEAYGLPWVYEVRGQLADTWASTRPESARSSQRYRLFKEREAFVAARATHVVTLGETMKSLLVAQGVPSDKISIAPNSIGDAYLEEPIERSWARASLGLSPDLQYVGTVSSLVAYEGLDLLIRAAAELIPENPKLRVLIVGSGVESNNLRELGIELGIDEYCIFTGRVPRNDARTYHCALDIFVVPRRDLSVTQAVTPLKPVEALACEVPVIAADLPALREIVADGVTGKLVPPEDAGKLARAIRSLLEDPSKRASMGVAGRRTMLAERTWSANARKLSETYKLITDKLQ